MRYPGGKGRCFQQIVSMMPPHRVYLETHLGGGAVLRHKSPATISIGIDADPAVVRMWAGHGIPRLEVVLGDAVEFLRAYDFRGDELVYCDPPYLQHTRRRRRVYRHEYAEEQHRELLALLLTLPCPVMVSGYRSSLYDEILVGWTAVEFPGDSHVGPTVEVVWRNFDVPGFLHDYSFIGADFREREAIRRRRRSLSRRIEALSAEERQALFKVLAERHGIELEGVLGRGDGR